MAEVTLTNGDPVTPEHRELDPTTGQQKGYVVLSAEERAKGFIRPVRRAYVHVGQKPIYPVRDLTDDEKARYSRYGYVKFEAYPDGDGPLGRYWTDKELAGGCGVRTTMAQPLAETYAAKPTFYGSTFCCGCMVHLPVAEFVWDGTDERVGS